MFAQYLVFVVLSTLTLALPNDDPSLHRYRGHVIKKDDKFETVTALESSYKIPDVNVNTVIASGFWDQSYNITGWSVLEIKTAENQTNIDQVYAAGLLEGRLTRELTGLQWLNSIDDICSNNTVFCSHLKQFFEIQLDWIYSQIESHPDDEYWHQVQLTLVQLNGLIDGNRNISGGQPRKEIEDPLGFFLFQVVESIGDLAERLGVQNVERRDSCSALIKILPDKSDIFVSHADWSNYKTMLKVIKRYTMPLKRSSAADSAPVAGVDTIFSSYPGTLHSVDDFYMTRPAAMTIIETTVVNYNADLRHDIIPISVPEWIRVIVSNRLANSGQQWIDKFFLNNDGTYNNQWMIADYKLFTPGQPPKAGFLSIGEQMVTEFQSQDMTDILNNKTYWASYNNVYFPHLRDISGEDKMVQEKGPELYSWQNSSRAKIFARDHSKVVDLPTMVYMMRYNNFQNDSLSACNCTPPYSAELTIASRCDLNPINGNYPDPPLGHRVHGATDAKIASYAMMQNFTLLAIAGPTTQGQPPFQWSKSDFDKEVPHFGHPDLWNFGNFKPTWVLP